MKIGIIGSGNVGGTLGKRWAQKGHDVCFGVLDTADPKLKQLLADSGAKARAATVAEMARMSDVVVLATPWGAVPDAIKSAGNLSGKILIDVTNPLLPDLSSLTIGTTTSAGEQVAELAKSARVVKAFNTIRFGVMADTTFPQGPVALFYCGDDAEAKKTVAGLAVELGFKALDAGPLTQCRVIEPFGMLWISLAVKYGYGQNIAFQFMQRRPENESN
jgi:8-hydroxy-5-deazaflavin:NADPH oxidoreductase